MYAFLDVKFLWCKTPRKVGWGVGTVPDGFAIRLKSLDFNRGGWVGITLRQLEHFRFAGSFARKPCWPSKRLPCHPQLSWKGGLLHPGSPLHLLIQFPPFPVMLPIIRASHTPHVRAAARVKQDTNNEQATNDDNRFQHR